ncbi:MAG: SRPBCC family protein [Chloroflexota bacterium]
MKIDRNAPAFARRELLIHAPVEKVWQIQTDLENWPKWQSEIAYVKLEGDLKEGTTFRWKAKGLTITSRLHTVQPPYHIGWSGTAPGMTAIHNWSFEGRGEDTLVITEESLSGWLTRLMLLFDRHFLEKSLETALLRLKQQAESNLIQ